MILKIVNKYPSIQTPCSMLVNSTDELEGHMSRIYQMSHFHYILGKKYIGDSDFPNGRCKVATVNLTLSSIKNEYANASYAYSDKWDHGYTIFPFVFKGAIPGVVIADPTSDQLYSNQSKPRNSVFIKLGLKWKYKTDWANGKNLFPQRIASIDVIRANSQMFFKFGHMNIRKYFETAFSNQIEVKL